MVENFRRAVIREIAFTAGSVIVCGSLLYLLSLKLNSEAAAVASDRDAIRNHSELIAGLASVKSNASEVGKYTRALGVILPKEDQLVNFSGWLDGLSRAHQVSENFSFQGEVTASGKSEAGYANFSLDANGAYDNLIDFLKDVEFRAPAYLVGFDSVDLGRGGAGYRSLIHGRIFFR